MRAGRRSLHRLGTALSLAPRWVASRWRTRALAHRGSRVEARAGVQLVGRGRISLGQQVRLMRAASLVATERGSIDVGDRTYIGDFSWIVANASIQIGSDVLIAPFCYIQDTDHGFESLAVPINQQPANSAPIVIEDDVWLGAHTVVTRGVRIGRGAVIGAGSVVTRDIAPWSVAVGSPARAIRRRGRGQEATALDAVTVEDERAPLS